MHASIWSIQHDVSFGRKHNERSSGAVMFLRKGNRRCVRRCNDDCLFLRLIHDLDTVSTLGDNSLHLVLCNIIPAIELVAGRLLHSIPQATENYRPFRVSVFKSNSDLIADLRHEHEAAIGSGVR